MSLGSKRTALAGVLALAAAWGMCLVLLVQQSEAQRPDETSGRETKPGKVEKGAPKVEWLDTKDGVRLHVEYRPAMTSKKAAKDGKGSDIVPVLLLHMAKGSGRDWGPLADSLQRAGHFVIVPDLRGHGKSTQVKRGGRTARIDQATMRKEDYERMVTLDLERIKKFIIEKNNNSELNLRKLCVVGAEMGAAVAINWAAMDWSWPPLATGPQGQDVNGLVLITPIWGYKGMSIVNATRQAGVQRAISTLVIVGAQDSGNLNDARRLHQTLAKHREDYSSAPREEWQEKQSIFFQTPKTSLEGSKMLGERSLGVERAILDFIRMRLVNQEAAWALRKGALD
ncbi:MAG: alpha/beta fold hydrolase [Pirellulales bacterium]